MQFSGVRGQGDLSFHNEFDSHFFQSEPYMREHIYEKKKKPYMREDYLNRTRFV